MDPTLFRIDWEILAEVLVTIVVLSFFLERALSLVFEHRLYVWSGWGFKAPIAFLVSLNVVAYWNFDAVSIILSGDQASPVGFAVTAAIIAGGSKGSLKLFHDVMNLKPPIPNQETAKDPATASPAQAGVTVLTPGVAASVSKAET